MFTSISLFVVSLHLPALDVDVTGAFVGQPRANPPFVLPSTDAAWLFSFNELPSFFRYDVASKRKSYVGEKISVATFKGPTIRTITVSQANIRGERLQLVPGHPAAVKPIAAIAKNKLLVLAASGGLHPLHKTTRQPRHAFSISVVRLDGRGSNPNSDYILPRDDYGWYEAIDAYANPKSGLIEVLMAHTSGTNSRTRIEAYRVSGKKLARIPDKTGRYAKVTGRTFRIWPSVALARGEWPYSPDRIAADPKSGTVAFVNNGRVTINSREVSLANVDSVRYLNGRLYAGTRSTPNMDTVLKTFMWDTSRRRFEKLGDYSLVGVSLGEKAHVRYFPANGKFILVK